MESNNSMENNNQQGPSNNHMANNNQNHGIYQSEQIKKQVLPNRGGAITSLVGFSIGTLFYGIFALYILLFNIIFIATNKLSVGNVAGWILIIVFIALLALNILGLVWSIQALKNPQILLRLLLIGIFSFNLISLIGGCIHYGLNKH